MLNISRNIKMARDSKREIKGMTEGSKIYSKTMVAAEGMNSSLERNITHRVVAYDGSGPDAKPLFGTEPCKTVFNYHEVIGTPGGEPELVQRYLSANNKFGLRRKGGIAGFGGLHSIIREKFELIEGKHYAITTDEVKVKVGELEEVVDQDGMFDINGNLLSNKRYDKMERYIPTPDIAKEVGDVILVREGDKQGIMKPDGSFVGGLQVVFDSDKPTAKRTGRVNLKRFGKRICLHVEKGHEETERDADGREQKKFIPDEEMYVSKRGRILYGGWCFKLEEFRIGKMMLGFAKDTKEKGKGKGQLHTIIGDKVYGGPWFRFHERKLPYGKKRTLLQAYDEQGLLIVDSKGNNHHGPHHYDPNKKGAEMQFIDGEDLARFFDEEKRDQAIRYWGFDNRIAYGGSHDKEVPAGEEEKRKPLPKFLKEEGEEAKEEEIGFTIRIGNRYSTVKKFIDRGMIGLFAKDPIDDESGNCQLFGGYHLAQKQFMPWAGEPYYVFQDNEGDALFHWTGEIVGGGYHRPGSIKKKLRQIDKQVGADLERFPFVEIKGPILSRIRRFLTHGVCGLRYLIGWKKPLDLYDFKGRRYDSEKDVKNRFQIPEDAELKDVTDTAANLSIEEAVAKLDGRRSKMHPSIEKLVKESKAEMKGPKKWWQFWRKK